jgi:hypothetical protein
VLPSGFVTTINTKTLAWPTPSLVTVPVPLKLTVEPGVAHSGVRLRVANGLTVKVVAVDATVTPRMWLIR